MPPRKRKASSKPATPASKKVRIENDEAAAAETVTSSARPKRMSLSTPQYNFTRRRKVPEKQTNSPSHKAKSAVPAASDPPRGRGRPRKTPAPPATARAALASRSISSKSAPQKSTTKEPVPETIAAPRKRGRPRKDESTTTATTTIAKKPVGNKKKTSVKKAGRSRKTQNESSATLNASQTTDKGTLIPRKRGRPRKLSLLRPEIPLEELILLGDSGADEFLNEDEAEGDEEEEHDSGDRQYWLLKAEPNDRYENGVNVKFSIDDLAAATGPEPWDGVRNYVARNHMRAMRKGDLAFFYHSNCQVPGIVGVMRIVNEHTPDESAFDPDHPYYDPKSDRDNPKWDCVHVEFVKKFETQITLKMMQENKSKNGVLSGMQLLRLGRLSVSSVTRKEWRRVLEMANEDVNVGHDDESKVVDDGYEAETDGEVDGGPKEELNGIIANGMANEGDKKD